MLTKGPLTCSVFCSHFQYNYNIRQNIMEDFEMYFKNRLNNFENFKKYFCSVFPEVLSLSLSLSP